MAAPTLVPATAKESRRENRRRRVIRLQSLRSDVCVQQKTLDHRGDKKHAVVSGGASITGAWVCQRWCVVPLGGKFPVHQNYQHVGGILSFGALTQSCSTCSSVSWIKTFNKVTTCSLTGLWVAVGSQSTSNHMCSISCNSLQANSLCIASLLCIPSAKGNQETSHKDYTGFCFGSCCCNKRSLSLSSCSLPTSRPLSSLQRDGLRLCPDPENQHSMPVLPPHLQQFCFCK